MDISPSTFMILTIELVVALLFAVAIRSILYITTSRRLRTPPGPKQLPLLGNLFDFPRDKQWVAFTNWKKRYGNVVYLNVLGSPMVALNSMDTCTDLLEKRSTKYSGRPKSVVLSEYMGFDYSFPSMDYSPRWRKYRKLFHQHFNEHVTLTYRPILERGVHHLLQRLLTKPDDFLDHVCFFFGETIIDVVYGIQVDSRDNIFIRVAERAVHAALEVTIPGRFLVDFFPAMKLLPCWCPGGTFKKFAAERKKDVLDAKDLPFAYVKTQIDAGTAGPSILSSMLEKCKEWSRNGGMNNNEEAPEDVAKACAAIAYLGGADSTHSTIQALFMAIANHRDVQNAAWAEIEALLGSAPSRLPSYGDEAQLPFVVAMTKELLRWHNVVPLGVPHVLMEDDEYNGYFIPKGTVVFPNIWGILHDPEVYAEPFTFNPWRWVINTPEGLKLNPAVPDPTAAFGFGRRICPGRHLASSSLFITVASILTCFDIRPLDTQGKPAERVDEIFTSGLIQYPAPFKVSITPRSGHLAGLINDLSG